MQREANVFRLLRHKKIGGKTMKKAIKKFFAAVISICLVFGGACTGGGADLRVSQGQNNSSTRKQSGKAVDLAKSLTADASVRGGATSAFTDANLSFATELFRRAFTEEKNTLVSPLSMSAALAMVANGARNATLEEIETVLGAPMSALNAGLSSYLDYLRNLNGESLALSVADSIWIKETYAPEVNGDFLQINKDYYDAEIFSAPFDESTKDDINGWVEEHTGGMIKDTLEKIDPDIFMYLVNALYFAGQWEEIYSEDDVWTGAFSNLGGDDSEVKMMYSEEKVFISDENTVGFVKPYKGGKLAFAALLPDEETPISEYVAGMSATKWENLFGKGMKSVKAPCCLPAFDYDFDFDSCDILSAMGMPSAFENRADFSGLLPDTKIKSVIQKTKIEVSEMGTKAAAVTIIGDEGTSVNPYEVYLNRPFVYAIVDTENYYPLFLGAVTNLPNV